MTLTLAAVLLLTADPAPPPQTTPIIDTDKTMAGQPLVVPPAPMKVVANRVVLRAGSEIPTHMHFWARYVYVQSGEVQLILAATGERRTFRTGEMIVEPIGKWHSGRIIADTVLVALEQVPSGRCNTVRPPDANQANDC